MSRIYSGLYSGFRVGLGGRGAYLLKWAGKWAGGESVKTLVPQGFREQMGKWAQMGRRAGMDKNMAMRGERCI